MRIDLPDRPVVDLAGAPIGRRRGERLLISWDLVAFCDRTVTLIVRKHLLSPS